MCEIKVLSLCCNKKDYRIDMSEIELVLVNDTDKCTATES